MLSITRIQSGDACNVIPWTARLAGTVRAMKRETMSLIKNNTGSYGGIGCHPPRQGERTERRAVAMPNNDRSALASTRGVTAEGEAGGFGAADGTF